MAVVVDDNRTVRNAADATTGWNTGSLNTTNFAEGTGSISDGVSISTGQLFHTGAAEDFTDVMIYLWSANSALQAGWDSGANSPAHGLYISDGTNDIVFHMAGNDRITFLHLDDNTLFQCFLLDQAFADQWNTDGHTTALAGSYAALDWTQITEIGAHYETLSKALTGDNVFIDIIRQGNNGISVTGGSTGDPGDFLEVVQLDRSSADGRGHGIIREYTAGIYGLQGPIFFGSNSGDDTWFQDDAVVLAFEDRPIADDKLHLTVLGSSGAGDETHWILTNSTITTARPQVFLDFSDPGIDELILTGCSLIGLGGTCTFANDSDALNNHTVIGNVFQGQGQIDAGDVLFQNNTIDSSADEGGALLIGPDGADNMQDLQFISDGTGHAILINTPGTYTFNNFTYDGFGSAETPHAAVFNNSSGAVTILITGDGDTPTVRNGSGASTSIVNPLTIIIRGVTEGARCLIEAAAGGDLSEGTVLLQEEANASGEAEDIFNGTTPQPVRVVVRRYRDQFGNTYREFEQFIDITGSGLDVTAVWQIDDIAE